MLRPILSETLGSALLALAVVGSGITAQALAPNDPAVALLANTGASVCALYALIVALQPVSGAHFNPLVSIAAAQSSALPWRRVLPFCTAQLVGFAAGVLLTHVMFDLPVLQAATATRSGIGKAVGEAIATFTLLMVIAGSAKRDAAAVAAAVAAVIASGYWFTSSSSFANPTFTLVRALTDTAAGIRWQDVPTYLVGQFIGGGLYFVLGRRLFATP